jgi:protein-S-isoprenylcysteine O-methyltransferase Ste14
MKALELKIPPPIVAIIFAGCMWIVARISPDCLISFPYKITWSSILSIAGGIISGLGILSFLSAGTTLNSMRINSVSTFVVSGIYCYTRNPMYLGLLFVLLGWLIFLSNLLTVLFIPLFILYMNYFQIKPEEKVLEKKYGKDFIHYKLKVGRWL